MPIYIIAIDLGKTGGALSLLKKEKGNITVLDYLKTTEKNKPKQIKFIIEAKIRYGLAMVIIEEPYLQSKQQGATTSFIQLGWFQGILDYLMLTHMVIKPRKWQELITKFPIDNVINKEYTGNSNRKNKGETKKLSLSYVKANHPNVAIRGPRGGWYDGLADSICIGEYYFRYINK
jgi:hypothetical protein